MPDMKEFVVLIPPSEGKAQGGTENPLKPSAAAKRMIKTLQAHKKDKSKLLGVKGTTLNRAITVNRQLLSSKTLPAIERYDGVLYKGLDYASLDNNAKKYADEHLAIVSALFGLLRTKDMIPDYRLKIDKLNTASYWKPLISEILKDKFVIDLLPQAHKKAVDIVDGISVEFIIIKGGKIKPAGHMGKFIKGRFVRWLCENGISDIGDFKNFSEEGFRWDGNAFVLVEN